MGIFKGLFRTRDAPQNRTAGSSYSFFMGGSAFGKQVNERTSMQMTAVYSCVRILSEAVFQEPRKHDHRKDRCALVHSAQRKGDPAAYLRRGVERFLCKTG